MQTVRNFVSDNFPIFILCAVVAGWVVGVTDNFWGPIVSHYAHFTKIGLQ